MGTLGKILLFVNLLAAVGVTYMAAQDYGRRQEVAGTALQYQVVLVGLPVEAPAGSDDAIPFPVETANGKVVETISKKRLDVFFQGYEGGEMGGAPSATQVKEVDRVEGKVKAMLDAASPAEQLALLCGRLTQNPNTGVVAPDPSARAWLLRMAESFDERDLIREMSRAANPDQLQANVAAARQMLEKRFAAVRAKPNAAAADAEVAKMKEATEALRAAAAKAQQAAAKGDDQATVAARNELSAAYAGLRKAMTDVAAAAPRDETDRRRRIAHLLMHLDPAAPWQKRVALVCGLRTYLAAIRAQADRFQAMAVAVQQQKVLDQARFADEYELLKTLAVQQSLLLNRQVAVTTDLREQRARDLEFAKARFAQQTARQAELTALKADVAEALKRQAAAEAELFEVERRVGDALRATFELERKLETAEMK